MRRLAERLAEQIDQGLSLALGHHQNGKRPSLLARDDAPGNARKAGQRSARHGGPPESKASCSVDPPSRLATYRRPLDPRAVVRGSLKWAPGRPALGISEVFRPAKAKDRRRPPQSFRSLSL